MQTRSVNIDSLSSQTASELVAPLTNQLRNIAFASGWPVELIQALTVEIDDTHTLYVNYPDEAKEAVENMEYGDINGLPNAVIRPFILRAPALVEETLRKSALQDLFIGVGIL